MFIENIHVEDKDEVTGTKIVNIRTKKTTIVTPKRASPNSWCNTFYKDKECKRKEIPTSWVEISNKIANENAMKDIEDNLGSKADYLKSLTSTFRQNKIVEYFPVVDNLRYDKDGESKVTTLINLGIFSKADIIAIPDFNENTTLFRNKIRYAEKLIESHPNGDKLDYIPYIRSDSRKFKEKLSSIVSMGINKIGVDYRGFGITSRTNFNKLQNFVRNLDKDILVRVAHLTRKLHGTNASAPHLMMYFGADITSERVNNPPFYLYDKEKKEMPPRTMDSVLFFNPFDLGVLQTEELPLHFGVDCNCPYHKKERKNKENKFFSEYADKMADKSRICEIFASDLECERSKPAIKESTYITYMKGKNCVKGALKSLNNKLLDNF
jgi:hypothetical protein